MKIYIGRTSDVDFDLFNNVLDILNDYSGPLSFVANPIDLRVDADDISVHPFKKKVFIKQQKAERLPPLASIRVSEERAMQWPPDFPEIIKEVKWETLFDKCESIRTKEKLSATDTVCLLTTLTNDKNWFTAWDPTGRMNFFVDAGQWEYFVNCDARFPIAYHVLAAVLRMQIYGNVNDVHTLFHTTSCGCMNDFCAKKSDVTFKLRTADICHECMQLMEEKNVDRQIIDQVFKTFDAIRTQMLFRERFKSTRKPSRIAIKGANKQIYFLDLGNAELKLTPLEKTLYLLFLDHPEGIHLSNLIDHKPQLENIYQSLGISRTVAELKNSIDQLVNPTENSVNEKLSRIRSKIIALVGEELAVYYLISGGRGEVKRVLVERKLMELG